MSHLNHNDFTFSFTKVKKKTTQTNFLVETKITKKSKSQKNQLTCQTAAYINNLIT
mgnify:CR=1 FL=1